MQKETLKTECTKKVAHVPIPNLTSVSEESRKKCTCKKCLRAMPVCKKPTVEGIEHNLLILLLTGFCNIDKYGRLIF